MDNSPASSHFVAALAHRPAPGSSEELLLTAIERLTGLSDQLRQTEADRRWAQIPSVVQEPAYAPSTTDGYVLTAAPMVGDLVQITHVLVSVPAGATGTLRLGTDHVLPNLPAGVSSLRMTKLLGPGDQRTLTIAGGSGGPAALILHGVQMAPTGSMAP